MNENPQPPTPTKVTQDSRRLFTLSPPTIEKSTSPEKDNGQQKNQSMSPPGCGRGEGFYSQVWIETSAVVVACVCVCVWLSGSFRIIFGVKNGVLELTGAGSDERDCAERVALFTTAVCPEDTHKYTRARQSSTPPICSITPPQAHTYPGWLMRNHWITLKRSPFLGGGLGRFFSPSVVQLFTRRKPNSLINGHFYLTFMPVINSPAGFSTSLWPRRSPKVKWGSWGFFTSGTTLE